MPEDTRNDQQVDRERPYWIEITGQASGTNRYAWEQVDDTDTAFGTSLDAGFKMSGTSDTTGWPAYEVNGRVDVPMGTKVQAYISAGGNFWIFQYGDEGSGTVPSSGTCELAVLKPTDCITATNSFDGIEYRMEPSGPGQWTSVDDAPYPLGEGPLVFTYSAGDVTLTLDGMELILCNDGGCWSGGPLTGHADDTEGLTPCDGETITICLRCSCCQIAGYEGEGWYCVDTGSGCEPAELLDEDKCDTSITICSGPYASFEEAEDECDVTGIITTCCPNHALPETLYAHFTNNVDCACLNGLTVELTWNAVEGRWKSADVPSGCAGENIRAILICGGSGSNNFAFSATCAAGGAGGGGTPAVGSCASASFTYTGLGFSGFAACCTGNYNVTVNTTP